MTAKERAQVIEKSNAKVEKLRAKKYGPRNSAHAVEAHLKELSRASFDCTAFRKARRGNC